VPLGLDPLQRQIQLLRGLASRCQLGSRQFHQRLAEQEQARAELFAAQAAQAKQLQKSHAQSRFQALTELDQQDERVSAAYERGTLVSRKQRTEIRERLQAERRRLRKEIQEDCQKQRQAALEQFEKCKDDPEKHKAAKRQLADKTIRPLLVTLVEAQQLSMDRLGTPELALPENFELPRYTSIDSARVAIEEAATRASDSHTRAIAAPARRWVDGSGMWLILVVSAALWVTIVYFLGPPFLALWMLGALPFCGLAGFISSLIFTPQVKRHTRGWLPHVAECEALGKSAAKNIVEIARHEAAEMAAMFARRRDAALKQAEEVRERKLAEMEARIDQELAAATDQLSRRLTMLGSDYNSGITELSEKTQGVLRRWTEQSQGATKALTAEQAKEQAIISGRHAAEQAEIAARVRSGLQRGLQRIFAAEQSFLDRFPGWESLLGNQYVPKLPLARLPLGWIGIEDYLRKQLSGGPPESPQRPSQQPNQLDIQSFLPTKLPTRLPSVAIVGQETGLLLECPAEHIEVARKLVQAVLLRLLSAVPAGKLRLTLIDPVGRGQSFAPLMALADHDPELVGHRAWAGAEQIEARLAELTHHMEDILQTYLRDRFKTIDEYNALAGAMAEPYRVIAALGFPAGLSQAGSHHLRALLDGGPRCGILSVLVIDPKTPWPHDLTPLAADRFLRLRLNGNGQWEHASDLLSKLPFQPIEPPSPTVQTALVAKIGQAAVNAERVVIPFREILGNRCDGTGDTGEGLETPLGRQGVGRTIELELGEGVRQHVLVAGKTGSGKSSLLHTMICAAALRYSPDQLHLYLLDFKKGVEFKPYADFHLPHGRVIGIESEREFGRSVLERLDDELHRRGEMFRGAGVQELAEYRRRTGKHLPRILLVVDEFQELFVRDDRIAQDCTLLLDRLIRQGRSFGVHAILASQSLAGAYSLPRNTLGQMAVRIALQCSESDAGLILSDDNTAARLLSRPGEAIYNDAGGLIEGNQPFQVAWLGHQELENTLHELADRYPEITKVYGPPVVFEGNRPARWNAAAIELALNNARQKAESALELCGVLGESVAIGPPLTVRLSRQAGRNLLIVSSEQALARDVLGTLIPSFAVDAKGKLSLIYLAGRPDATEETSAVRRLADHVANLQFVKPRDAEKAVTCLAEEVKRRLEIGDDHPHDPVVIIIDPLERFRDLRHDESLAYSFDATKPPGPDALAAILREGPLVGVHCILSCGGAEGFSRWLARGSQHDLELRILGRLSTSDAALLTDSADASSLGPAAMLVYDEARARSDKLRVFNLPEPDVLGEWLNQHRLDGEMQ
jgi:DNA segregation ATPase FtsK/SpoIIIE, S-DNA-T family